jgi:peptidoglycan/LPS O-acetylase OafA/YrhL
VTSSKKTLYRPDIDGLRAVAVLGVIFFHAGFSWIRGGFVGVDVFFVISGYLITGILIRELRQDTFSLARFYERRARRILPALLVVLAATLASCALIMFPHDQRAVARSAVGVIAFAANFLFWRGLDFIDATLVNYFGRRIHEQPLIHTWSLGVEEQYYLLFPAALLIVWRLKRAWLLPVLLAGTLGSLMVSAVLTPRSPGAAFYLLPSRIWELLAGGLLAWWAARPETVPASRVVREWVAATGLVLIVVAMAVFDSRTPFPGVYALAPVVGAALVIHSAPGTLAGRLLSLPAVVFIGLISYSAYLWHQPLFALARYVNLTDEMDPIALLPLCVLTLILAAITWRFVETPFRDRQQVSNRALWTACGIGVLVIAVSAAVLGFGGVGGRRSPIATGIVGQSILALFTDCNPDLQPTRRLGAGCLLNPSSAAPPTFLVLGDSHGDALYSAFARFSHDTGHQGRLIQHFGCSPLFETTEPNVMTGCRFTLRQADDVIEAHQIKRVIVVSRFAHAEYLPRESFARRFEKMVARFAERGIMVYVVRQAPEHPRFDRREYLRALLRRRFFRVDATSEIARMSVTRAEHDHHQAFVNGVFANYRDDPRVRFVDFTSTLCNDATCLLGTPSTSYYRDKDHMSDSGARFVSDTITRQLIELW